MTHVSLEIIGLMLISTCFCSLESTHINYKYVHWGKKQLQQWFVCLSVCIAGWLTKPLQQLTKYHYGTINAHHKTINLSIMITEIVSLILIYNLSVQFKCNIFIRHMTKTNIVQIELIRTYAFFIRLFSFSVLGLNE